ncbi:gluconolaconase [Streptomyces syringium]|uniref:gluconolaconase n=1 Tax=Streptomyces syringium TaxID=76729 RepID=UPI003405F9C5
MIKPTEAPDVPTDGPGSVNAAGKTYKPTRFMRHPLTTHNQKELDIEGRSVPLLKKWKEWEEMDPKDRPEAWKKVAAKVKKASESEEDRWIAPTGFSVNKVRYGAFPKDGDTAHKRGWRTYMNMGLPLIEERSDIQQPPPDLIAQHSFTNRTDPLVTTVTFSTEFSISNTIKWNLQGEMQLKFGAKSTASLQQQLQKSMAMTTHEKSTFLNSRDRQGSDAEFQGQASSTSTATSSATGTGELYSELMLAITGSVGGEFTTSVKATAQISIQIETRAVIRATQRRQVKRFDYELPIVFAGCVALYYPEEVELSSITNLDGEDDTERKRAQTLDPTGKTELPKYGQVIVRDIDIIGLVEEGKKYFSQKGEAEIVSVFAGETELFELEKLTLSDNVTDNKEASFYKS